MTSSDGTHGDDDLVVRLPFDPEAARLARELVERLLDQVLEAGRAADEVRQDAALVVHELVINAVVHGRPDAERQLEFSTRVDGGQLVVSVRDWGTTGRVAPKPPSQDAANGRGLAIVAALATSWTVDRSSGTRVSAHLEL